MAVISLGRMDDGNIGAMNAEGALVSHLDASTLRQPQQSVNQAWFNNGGYDEVAANRVANLDRAMTMLPTQSLKLS